MDAYPLGHLNIAFGWAWMTLGFISGMLMGLKVEQFGLNTLPVGPTWLDGYGSVPRRLMRLGHVAFIMLSVLNILYGMFIDGAHLTEFWRQAGSTAMILGAIGIPLLCFGAAFFRPLKLFLALPASCVLVGNLILAWGMWHR